jgi:DNA-binding MarR family transcriptional regulator
MTSQVLSTQAIQAWGAFLRGHAALTRTLNTQLVAEHELTIHDYEVLLRLSRAPDRRLKRVELSRSLLLTPSGITRLLDGLEAAGLVEKASCQSDARVTYAVLTDRGAAKLRDAANSHLGDVERHFGSRYGDAELETLAELLGRLDPVEQPPSCEPG